MNPKLRTILNDMQDLPEFTGIELGGFETVGKFGNTPLQVAAVRGDLDAIKILVEEGANLNSQGEHGYTPLHEAVEQNKPATVRLLLELGADATIRNDHGDLAVDICSIGDEDRSIIAKLFG